MESCRNVEREAFVFFINTALCYNITTLELGWKEARTYRFKPEQYFKVITVRRQSPLATTAVT